MTKRLGRRSCRGLHDIANALTATGWYTEKKGKMGNFMLCIFYQNFEKEGRRGIKRSQSRAHWGSGSLGTFLPDGTGSVEVVR